MTEKSSKRILSTEEAAAILSEALLEVAERRTTLRRALAISRLALALAKTIEVMDLRAKVEYLEQVLKKRSQA